MAALSLKTTTPRRRRPPRPPPKSSLRSPYWRRLRSRLGFQKTHNFVLFVLLGLVGVLGQGVLHSPKLDYFNVFCRRRHLAAGLHAAPGECYYFRNGGREQAGMMLHVYAVVPVCFLLALQFVPAVRRHRRWVVLHRMGGYAVLLLTGVAVGGGVVASPGSFGGERAWRVLVWVLGGMVLGGLGTAMGGIWRGRVELHRAWMLRTWAWAFSSITMRLLQQIGARLISPPSSSSFFSSSSSTYDHHHHHYSSYSSFRPCAQIASDGVMPDAAIAALWPACAAFLSGADPGQAVLVAADYGGKPIEANVALSVAAGPAGWAALVLHVVVVEVYLHLTASERTHRSRQDVDHRRHHHHRRRKQVATKDDNNRFGDSSEWTPSPHHHDHIHDHAVDLHDGGKLDPVEVGCRG